MSEIVDRAAKAMWLDVGGPWELLADETQEIFRRDVRKVIAALREPTEAMEKAGRHNSDVAWWEGDIPGIWRAMIDAALGSTP